MKTQRRPTVDGLLNPSIAAKACAEVNNHRPNRCRATTYIVNSGEKSLCCTKFADLAPAEITEVAEKRNEAELLCVIYVLCG